MTGRTSQRSLKCHKHHYPIVTFDFPDMGVNKIQVT